MPAQHGPPALSLLLALLLMAGCATSSPRKSLHPMSDEEPHSGPYLEEARTRSDERTPPIQQFHLARARKQALQTTSEPDPLDDLEKGWAGWRDGVGKGYGPFGSTPMSVDYFRGFLVQAGIPEGELPEDGRALAPEEALRLVPYLLNMPATLGDFGPRRMAAHLLLEVATGGEPVSRDALHSRMRRFSELLVLRPDGYLVKPTTGRAVQKVGEVALAQDGSLRAGRFEVGPFYAVEGGRLYPVDARLKVPPEALPAGIYEPDDNVLLAAAEGAGLALADMVEGLLQLVLHPDEVLMGLTQLPGAAQELFRNSPEYWEAFRHKPYAERVRIISRLTTNVLLVVGTSGVGAARAASLGSKLGHFAVPALSLTGEGAMALRLVAAVPVGHTVTATGQALSATYVLHMANMGAKRGGGRTGWKPPPGGPGKWTQVKESMKAPARKYQSQVTRAPEGWAYRIANVDFDGFEGGVLLEAKGPGYAHFFDAELDPLEFFEGIKGIRRQAQRQFEAAQGTPVRWYVAERKFADALRKLFSESGLDAIEVVHLPALP